MKGRRTQRANNIGNFVVMGGDRTSSQNGQYKAGQQERDGETGPQSGIDTYCDTYNMQTVVVRTV